MASNEFVFISDGGDVWNLTDTGWTNAKTGKSVSKLRDLQKVDNGAVYELVADISKLPSPEPKSIGAVHDTENATYIRFTSEDLTDPWICTRTGVRFSWHHIQ